MTSIASEITCPMTRVVDGQLHASVPGHGIRVLFFNQPVNNPQLLRKLTH